MKGRSAHLMTVALGLGALSLSTLIAAPKPKPPADIPGSFTVNTPCDVGENGPDRITGDCLGPYAADADGTYVILNGNREFRAGLYGTRYVQLDFSESMAGTLCATGCFRTFGDFVVPESNLYPPEGPYRVVMQTNVVDVNGIEIANGLMGIPAGNTLFARFFVSFEDPGGSDFHWSAIFNPLDYAGSNHVTVTRGDGSNSCTWTIAATVADTDANGPTGARAGLRAWNVKKGRNGNSDEGLFSMPFAITFSAPGCGA